MALVSRLLDVAPRPLELAASVADRPGAVLLWSAAGGGPSFVACDPIDRAGGLCPEPGLPLGGHTGDLSRAPRWIGALPYEARRDLERSGGARSDSRAAPMLSEPLWLRYAAVAEIGDRVRVIGDDASAVRELAERLGRPRAFADAELRPLEPFEPPQIHAARIRHALELIAKGDLYQVNIARRFRYRVHGDRIALLARLGGRARPPFGAMLALGDVDVVSTSPELFLALEPDGRVVTSPIKGTRPRGKDAASDRDLARELDRDPKERAELAMILDVERNDLGRIAETGTVRVLSAPAVVTHPTLHHRVASVGARLAPGVDRAALIGAMLPSGSVTGAPKIRAMDVIAELEPVRRGLYTGAFGALRHDGGLVLGMAIRTLTLRAGEAHYHVGGGIVADSDPDREVEETHWKAVQLSA